VAVARSQSAHWGFSLLAGTTVGNATSAAYAARYGFLPSTGPTDVTGRFVFYNQSAWDENSAAANPADDDAIAPDKIAPPRRRSDLRQLHQL
jgi:hypothetical protein